MPGVAEDADQITSQEVPYDPKRVTQIALRQDQRILRATSVNRAAFADTTPMVTAIDVMRPHISAILAGQTPKVATARQELVMEL